MVFKSLNGLCIQNSLVQTCFDHWILSNKLQKLKNRATQIITSSGYDADVDSLFLKRNWKDLQSHVKFWKP